MLNVPFNDDYIPEPPVLASMHELACDYRVLRIADDFRHAAGDGGAYYGSGAINSLRSSAIGSQPEEISETQRDCLVSAVDYAKSNIVGYFQGAKEATAARSAIRAIDGLIYFWAASQGARCCLAYDSLRNMDEHARWLQNALHNMVLQENINSRPANATTVMVDKMKLIAMSSSAAAFSKRRSNSEV